MTVAGRQSFQSRESENRSDWFAARRRLADFARTLRDNGFKVGLAESGDALEILTTPLALRPSTLKPALRSLFCATHSDWQRSTRFSMLIGWGAVLGRHACLP